MKRFRQGAFGLLWLILGSISSVLLAQDSCPAIVQAALTATNDACGSTGRNQACYGNIALAAEAQANVPDFSFTAAGDIADIAAIKTLILSSLSLTDNTWGVALMSVQANLPDTLPGQNVTMLLFGNVEIVNTVEQLTTLAMTATGGVNVRLRPTTNANVLSSLTRGAAVTATGRLADSSWIRIKLPDDSRGTGWVSAQFLQSADDVNTLNVVDAEAQLFGPMQSFYFKSGVGDAPCAEAPESGILIHTPKGVGQVNLTANGVDISLGSTVYVQAVPGDYMTVSTIEGDVSIQAFNVAQAVPAGTVARIPLDANGIASGPPEFPQPYEQAHVTALPVSILPEAVTIAAPLEASEVQNAVASAEGLPTPGAWRGTNDQLSACNSNYPTSFNIVLLVEDNGATIRLDTGAYIFKYIYTRTAPGVYSLTTVPLDYRQLGSQNITEQQTLQVVSPTLIQWQQTDFFPAQNCRATITGRWEFVG
jgi:hypothetical protein